jgi:membrane protein DedA with SNARE-associated domain
MRMFAGSHPKGERRAERVRRLMGRFGPVAVMFSYVLPVPTALVDIAAGWSRMRLAVFIVCDVVGALLWTGLLAGLGFALGQHAVDVVHKVSHYSLWLTLALVVVITVRSARRSRGPVPPAA